MKKLLTLITLVMVALLVSCGNIGDNSDNQKSEDQTEQSDIEDSNNTDNSKESSDQKGKLQEESTEQKKDSVEKKKDSGQLIINNINVGDKLSEIDSLNNRVVELENKAEITTNAIDNCYFCKYGIIAYIVYAIAIIVLFLILRIIWIIVTAKSPEAKKEEEKKKNQLKERINNLELKFSELEGKLDRIDGKVQNINNDVRSIGDNVVYAGSKIPEESNSRTNQSSQYGQTSRNNSATSNLPKHKQTVFYLKFPGIDGDFDYAPVPKAEGYYRFVLDSRNPNIAHFYFEPGDTTAMTRAINNRTYYIEMACDPISTVDGKVTSCRGEGNSYGEAKLENGKWIVKSKQKVRYE